jgi:hypothetical protein
MNVMIPSLSLTDAQIEMMTRAVALIAPHDRDGFLKSVANRIGHLPHPTDYDVANSVNIVLSTRGIAVGLKTSSIAPERKRRQVLQNRTSVRRIENQKEISK